MKELTRTEQNSVLSEAKHSNRNSTTVILKSFLPYRHYFSPFSSCWITMSCSALSSDKFLPSFYCPRNCLTTVFCSLYHWRQRDFKELNWVNCQKFPSLYCSLSVPASYLEALSAVVHYTINIFSYCGRNDCQSSSNDCGGIKAPPTNLASSRRKLNVAVAFA